MNERRRIELLLPLIAMLDVVESGVRAKVDPETVTCAGHIRAAMDAIMVGVTEPRKVLRRAARAHQVGLGRFAGEGARLDVYGYGLYYLLQVLTEKDVLVIGEDAYGKGLDIFLNALSRKDLDDLEETRARTQGRVMLQTYQALGYYHGIRWPELAFA